MINLKIKLFASNKDALNYLEKLLLLFFKKSDTKNFETSKLPNNYKNFAFLRSPHVNKKSKEHFFFVNKTRIIYLRISKLQFNYFLVLFQKLENVIRLEITYKEE